MSASPIVGFANRVALVKGDITPYDLSGLRVTFQHCHAERSRSLAPCFVPTQNFVL